MWPLTAFQSLVITVLCILIFILNAPNQIKTNIITDYYSQSFEMSYKQFYISHITKIPHNSQRQDIIEQARRTLQQYFYNKRGENHISIYHKNF